MKAIRRSPVTRAAAWLLTLILIMPAVLLGPVVARAQAPQSLDVIVADFVNKTQGGDALAQAATDAVAVELSNSGRFSPFKRQEVLDSAKKLGMRVPSQVGQAIHFTRPELLRIAKDLGASAIVEGDLEQARVVKNGSVSIGLKVTVLETSSLEYINGGESVGTASPRAGIAEDPEALLTEATTNASTNIVRTMVQRQVPSATVLNINAEKVILNRGLRDGIHIGDDLVIIRDGVKVGKVHADQVYATDTEANVVENIGGIRPEDSARLLYHPGTINGPIANPARPGIGKINPSIIGATLSAIGLGVLVAVGSRGGQQSVTDVVAEATTVNGTAPAVRIRWRDNIFGQAGVLQYHIWRLPDFPFSVSANTGNGNGGGGAGGGGGGTTNGILSGVPIGATESTRREFVDRAAPFAFYRNGFNLTLGTTGNTNNNNNGGTGGGNTGGTGNGGCTSVAIVSIISTGFSAGTTFQYQVSAAISRQSVTVGTGGTGGGGVGGGTGGGGTGGGTGGGNGNNNGGSQCIETDPATSGQATPINPVLLLSPADQAQTINIDSFSPTWTSRVGADVFQVEVSTDRTFPSGRVFRIGPIFSTSPFADGVTQSLPAPVKLRTAPELLADTTFANFANGVTGATTPTLFWRVGARHDSDNPGPVNKASDGSGDRTFRFVYSEVHQFTPAAGPPPPPSKAAMRLNSQLQATRAAGGTTPLPLPGASRTRGITSQSNIPSSFRDILNGQRRLH